MVRLLALLNCGKIMVRLLALVRMLALLNCGKILFDPLETFSQQNCTGLLVIKYWKYKGSSVAQLVEQSLQTPEVPSSNPVIGKIYTCHLQTTDKNVSWLLVWDLVHNFKSRIGKSIYASFTYKWILLEILCYIFANEFFSFGNYVQKKSKTVSETCAKWLRFCAVSETWGLAIYIEHFLSTV